MGSLATVRQTMPTAVANGASLTVPYPAGVTQAMLNGSTGGAVALNGNDVFKQGTGVTFTFGASDITITNNSGVAWAVGSELIATFGRTDIKGVYNLTNPKLTQDKTNAL